LSDNVLLVLIIREAGLRSMLAARLSLVGADLVTAMDIHDPAVQRNVRGPAVLVLDEDAVAGRSAEWLDAVVAEPQWDHVVVLTGRSPAGAAGDRLVFLERATAPATLAALVAQWRDAESSA
jgi:hypothetical protein